MIEIVRNHARDVKRWQPGDMRLRSAAAGMLEAEKQFRRVKGYSQLPQLASAIKKAVSTTSHSTVQCHTGGVVSAVEVATKFYGQRDILHITSRPSISVSAPVASSAPDGLSGEP